MMKRAVTIKLAFLLLLGFGFSNQTKASHGAAFELTYEHLGGLKYKIRSSFYRECTGASAPTSLNVYYVSSCSAQQSVVLQKVSGTGVSVPAKCITSSVCTQEYKYEGTVTLPIACNDWTFWTQTCCRPGNNQNVTGGGMYWEAFLNNAQAPNNSSPQFNSNVAVRDFCVNTQCFFDQSVTEVNGDSLVYKMIAARQNNYPGSPVTYIAPYSANNQVPVAAPGVQINSKTGMFSFTPTSTFVGSFCFMIEEWSYDTLCVNCGQPNQYYKYVPVKVGHIMRDLRVLFGTNCVVTPPVPYGDLDGNGNPIYDSQTGYPIINVQCGVDTFSYTIPDGAACGSIDPLGNDWKIIDSQSGSPVGPFIKADPHCKNGVSTRCTMTLIQGLGQGDYLMVLKNGNDLNTIVSDCGVDRQEFQDTILVRVKGTALSPLTDISICYPTQSLPKLDLGSGATGINWVINGQPISDTSQIISADSSGSYAVTWNFKGCPGSDTVQIQINQDPSIDLDDMIMCTGGTFPRVGSTVPGASLYSWSYNGIPFGGNSDTVQLVGPGTYIISVTDQNGCMASDTFDLTIQPELQINIDGDDTICETNTAALIELKTNVPGITQYDWYLDGSLLNGFNNPSINPGNSGWYKLIITTDPSCHGKDSMYVQVDKELPEPVVNCNVTDEDFVTFSWDPIPGASGYEVSVDGGATWIPSNGSNWHKTDISIQTILVRGVANSACPVGPEAASKECANEIIVPNVFTPGNADSKNDVFRIPYLELYPENHLVVYDRWGRKVFEANPYKNDWNGGKHSDGTYFYVLNLNDADNQIFKGTVTILK